MSNQFLPVGTVREYIIRPPQGTSFEPFLMLALTKSLANFELGLAIVCENETVTWRIYDFNKNADESTLIALIHQSYPSANVTVRLYEEPSFTEPFDRSVIPFVMVTPHEPFRPLQSLDAGKDRDPLTLFTQTLTNAAAGERVVYLVSIRRGLKTSEIDDAWRDITVSRANAANLLPRSGVDLSSASGWGTAIGGVIGGAVANRNAIEQEEKNPRLRVPKFIPEDQTFFQNKLLGNPYHCRIWLQIDTPVGAGINKYLPLLTILTEYSSDYQGLTPASKDIWNGEVKTEGIAKSTNVVNYAGLYSREPEKSVAAYLKSEQKDIFYKNPMPQPEYDCVLCPPEIAALWHMPTETFTCPIISWASPELPMPKYARNSDNAVCLGTALYGGKQEYAYLPYNSRVSHIYTIGRTRMGKSTFLHNLIHQDIQNGYGVAVIDPHGELIQDILRYSIPAERKDKVVLLEIANAEHPIPLNILTPPGNAAPHIVISTLMALFTKYGDFENTTTLLPALEKALWLLTIEERPTLRNIERIFTDKAYVYELLTKFHQLSPEQYNPSVVAYWKAFYNRAQAQQTITGAPLLQKLADFYGMPELYRIICHPERLDFTSLIKDDSIILLSLADPQGLWTDKQKHFIGGTLLSHIQLGAHSRGHQPKPLYLYIDEVQHFISTNLASIFSESGKFGLSLTVANQYLRQLTGDTLDAIKGNVGSMVIFRVGEDDAPILAKSLRSVQPTDLLSIRPHSAIVSAPIAGELHTFSVRGLQPVAINAILDGADDEDVQAQVIRQASIDNYTPRTKTQVAQWLYDRYDQTLDIALDNAQSTPSKPDDFLVENS